MIDIPLPPQDSTEIDDAAHAAMHVIIGQMLDAGSAIGWHRAELLTGLLANVLDEMVGGAGEDAVADLLADVRAQIAARQDQRSG